MCYTAVLNSLPCSQQSSQFDFAGQTDRPGSVFRQLASLQRDHLSRQPHHSLQTLSKQPLSHFTSFVNPSCCQHVCRICWSTAGLTASLMTLLGKFTTACELFQDSPLTPFGPLHLASQTKLLSTCMQDLLVYSWLDCQPDDPFRQTHHSFQTLSEQPPHPLHVLLQNQAVAFMYAGSVVLQLARLPA